jgi:hypothetical protein
MAVDATHAPDADADDAELDRRTNEFLRFVVDRGLVDLYVDEDGEFEFTPTRRKDTDGPLRDHQCPPILAYAQRHMIPLCAVLVALYSLVARRTS